MLTRCVCFLDVLFSDAVAIAGGVYALSRHHDVIQGRDIVPPVLPAPPNFSAEVKPLSNVMLLPAILSQRCRHIFIFVAMPSCIVRCPCLHTITSALHGELQNDATTAASHIACAFHLQSNSHHCR
eukprot:scpid38354/ scgid18469/ 